MWLFLVFTIAAARTSVRDIHSRENDVERCDKYDRHPKDLRRPESFGNIFSFQYPHYIYNYKKTWFDDANFDKRFEVPEKIGKKVEVPRKEHFGKIRPTEKAKTFSFKEKPLITRKNLPLYGRPTFIHAQEPYDFTPVLIKERLSPLIRPPVIFKDHRPHCMEKEPVFYEPYPVMLPHFRLELPRFPIIHPPKVNIPIPKPPCPPLRHHFPTPAVFRSPSVNVYSPPKFMLRVPHIILQKPVIEKLDFKPEKVEKHVNDELRSKEEEEFRDVKISFPENEWPAAVDLEKYVAAELTGKKETSKKEVKPESKTEKVKKEEKDDEDMGIFDKDEKREKPKEAPKAKEQPKNDDKKNLKPEKVKILKPQKLKARLLKPIKVVLKKVSESYPFTFIEEYPTQTLRGMFADFIY